MSPGRITKLPPAKRTIVIPDFSLLQNIEEAQFSTSSASPSLSFLGGCSSSKKHSRTRCEIPTHTIYHLPRCSDVEVSERRPISFLGLAPHRRSRPSVQDRLHVGRKQVVEEKYFVERIHHTGFGLEVIRIV